MDPNPTRFGFFARPTTRNDAPSSWVVGETRPWIDSSGEEGRVTFFIAQFFNGTRYDAEALAKALVTSLKAQSAIGEG